MDLGSGTIYTASDLARRRRALLDAARRGVARLRDTDGTSLVMLREDHVLALTLVARWSMARVRLADLLGTPAPSRPIAAYGDAAWLRVFDDDDLRQFLRELDDALVAATADESPRPLEELLAGWRATADALADPAARAVLLGGFDPRDFEEVDRPA